MCVCEPPGVSFVKLLAGFRGCRLYYSSHGCSLQNLTFLLALFFPSAIRPEIKVGQKLQTLAAGPNFKFKSAKSQDVLLSTKAPK